MSWMWLSSRSVSLSSPRRPISSLMGQKTTDGRCSKLGKGHQSKEVSSDFEQVEQVALPALIISSCLLERGIERKSTYNEVEASPLAI